MGILLLVALIGVPLIEIGLFIEIGGFIGLWSTLFLVVATAMLGSWQLRAQGLATLARAREQMDQGRLPTRELFDGFCLVIAGALLLTPGFMTDAIGLALFVPAFRDLLRRTLARRLETSGHMEVWVDGEEVDQRRTGAGGGGGGGGGVIEGEFRDITEERPEENGRKEPDKRDPDPTP